MSGKANAGKVDRFDVKNVFYLQEKQKRDETDQIFLKQKSFLFAYLTAKLILDKDMKRN